MSMHSDKPVTGSNETLATVLKSFGEKLHAATERSNTAADASTAASNLSADRTQRVFYVLCVSAFFSFALVIGQAFIVVQSVRQQSRQEGFARELEAIKAQVSTVQATANSTKDSVEVIEDRPFLDSEIVPIKSASSGPPQPVPVVVLRKSGGSASSQPVELFTVPVPIPSVPPSSSAPAPEPRKP